MYLTKENFNFDVFESDMKVIWMLFVNLIIKDYFLSNKVGNKVLRNKQLLLNKYVWEVCCY